MTTAVQSLLQSGRRKEALRAIALLIFCVLLALAAVFLATTSRARAQNENMEEQGAAAAAAQSGESAEDLEIGIPRLIDETARLRKAGFDRPADRVTWVDAAVRALDRLHPIAYTIEADVARIQAAGGRLQQRYEEAGLDPPQLDRNDLLLRVQGLQEDELLDVIDQIVADGGGVVRIEHCKLALRSDGVGLDADCRLGRYSLRRANPGAVP